MNDWSNTPEQVEEEDRRENMTDAYYAGRLDDVADLDNEDEENLRLLLLGDEMDIVAQLREEASPWGG